VTKVKVTTTPLFLDTTIQVDRILRKAEPDKLRQIEELLGDRFLLACSYSRLEYKRVVLQNLALCLTYLVEEGSFFKAMIRASAIGAHAPRRLSTLVKVLAWMGSELNVITEEDVGGEYGERLAMRAESYYRNTIRYLWKRFDKSVDSITDGTKCTLSDDPPLPKTDGTFTVQIHESKCLEKRCNNANFFRSKLPEVRRICETLDKLEGKGVELTAELLRIREGMKAAMNNPARLYNYKNCMTIGDAWIHLECLAAKVKDFATTNYKESEHLCPILGLEMKRPY
jgi:hypothetical protein